MERELGQIEKRQKSIDPKQDSDDDEDNVPFSTLKSITDTQEEVSEAQGRPGHLGMLSDTNKHDSSTDKESSASKVKLFRMLILPSHKYNISIVLFYNRKRIVI